MRNLLSLLLLLCISTSVLAQEQYSGYSTSNYNGVNAVFFNPADIVQTPYKWHVNLFGTNLGIGNNNSYISLETLQSAIDDINNETTNELDMLLRKSVSSPLSGFINTDLLLPSFMINLNSKNTLAIFTRYRVLGNVKDVDGPLLNVIKKDVDNNVSCPYTFDSGLGQVVSVNAFGEVGVTWARTLLQQGKNHLKAGLSAKFMIGTGNAHLGLNNVNGTLYDDKNVDRDYHLSNAWGIISASSLGVSDLDSISKDNFISVNGRGFGADFGFVYERQKDGQTEYQPNYSYKVGVAVSDLGFIKYIPNSDYTSSYNVHIGKDQYFNLNEIEKVGDVIDVLDSHPEFFTKLPYDQELINLPTTIRGNFDYNFFKNCYADLTVQYAFAEVKGIQDPVYRNYVTITPRYEGKWFGAYVPINYNELSNFNVGLSLRLGPVYVGSESVISFFSGESKQMDVHFGIAFGGFHKKKKEESEKQKDLDKDGIPDDRDECPSVAGLEVYNGCPNPPTVDADGDGIKDEDDKCPNQFGTKKYEGCPTPDTDGDGVDDDHDKCPKEKGLEIHEGCPVTDADGDGIDDEDDKCPRLAGVASNDGCPEVKKEIIQKVTYTAKNIFFETAKDKLKLESKEKLDDLARILEEDKNLKLSIEGHTDSVGNDDSNLRLSEKRANAVKRYLMYKGISSARLSAIGLGETMPIGDNSTASGREKNRRVEMKLNY